MSTAVETSLWCALWVEVPDEAPYVLRMDKRVVTIGRSESNSIRVDADLVSRFHTEIVARDGKHTLRDLGSKNGTFLNTKAVEEQILANGDVIQVGPARMRFVVAESAEALAVLERQAAAPPTATRPRLTQTPVAPLSTRPKPADGSATEAQLDALAQLARQLHGRSDELTILNEVVAVLPNIVPCQQARVLLVEEESHNPLFYASPEGAEDTAPSEHVIQMGLLADETMCMGASPNHNPLLLVPLFDRGRRRGFVVFERSRGEAEYDPAEHNLASVAAALITGFLRYAL